MQPARNGGSNVAPSQAVDAGSADTGAGAAEDAWNVRQAAMSANRAEPSLAPKAIDGAEEVGAARCGREVRLGICWFTGAAANSARGSS